MFPVDNGDGTTVDRGERRDRFAVGETNRNVSIDAGRFPRRTPSLIFPISWGRPAASSLIGVGAGPSRCVHQSGEMGGERHDRGLHVLDDLRLGDREFGELSEDRPELLVVGAGEVVETAAAHAKVRNAGC